MKVFINVGAKGIGTKNHTWMKKPFFIGIQSFNII
jgi:hypothetical protein